MQEKVLLINKGETPYNFAGKISDLHTGYAVVVLKEEADRITGDFPDLFETEAFDGLHPLYTTLPRLAFKATVDKEAVLTTKMKKKDAPVDEPVEAPADAPTE